MFKVFQIKINREVRDYVNSNKTGHSGAEAKYPIYETHMRVSLGFGNEVNFLPEDFQHYTQVCEVARDGGLVNSNDEKPFIVDHVEEVFSILNGKYFDEDTEKDIVHDAHVSGFKTKTVTRNDGEVVTLRDMHSLSVGDIVYDSIKESYNIVAGFGFQDITGDVLQGVQKLKLSEVS